MQQCDFLKRWNQPFMEVWWCQSNGWLLNNYIYYCSNWSVWPLNPSLSVCVVYCRFSVHFLKTTETSLTSLLQMKLRPRDKHAATSRSNPRRRNRRSLKHVTQQWTDKLIDWRINAGTDVSAAALLSFERCHFWSAAPAVMWPQLQRSRKSPSMHFFNFCSHHTKVKQETFKRTVNTQCDCFLTVFPWKTLAVLPEYCSTSTE